MQTFLPYASFAASAGVLDRQRLGKQRVEAWQLLQTLTGQKKGWSNHPAAKMWAGHEYALAEYGLVICRTWVERGYIDNMAQRIADIMASLPEATRALPDWLGDESFHAAHRSNLLRKAPEWYSQFDWDEPDDLPYVWPV